MISLRIDVDYPYPSRITSFVCTTLGIKLKKNYLKNSKIIARMINESPREVKATWFFTPTTIPDNELLSLLNNDRNEVAVHFVNNPYSEWKNLEKTTGKKVKYYTIHGTKRLLARIMWKRWRTKSPKIPSNSPLISFYQFPTKGLDVISYSNPPEKTLKIAQKYVKEGCILHFHPIWLFQRGKINQRGPFYETLKRILEVDRELETIRFRRKAFFKIANDAEEYARNIIPTQESLEKLRERGADIFTFLERKWCYTVSDSGPLVKANDNIALLHVTSYEDWWRSIGKKTRNMIRKAEKSGIKTGLTQPSDRLAEGVWKIYNETPIRQERAFPHYGTSLKTVKESMLPEQNCTYVTAYFQDELVGFVQLVHGDKITMISQILSLQKHWEKAVNNALVAKAVEFCANRREEWVMYGRMGNHPTLDQFKQNNGFSQLQLARYYVPLTRKGKTAIELRLHRELKDSLPQALKYPLFPFYNWVSRVKIRIKLRMKPRKIT